MGKSAMPAMMARCGSALLVPSSASAYMMTGDQEQAHRLGWQVAALVAEAANLRRVDDDEPGWSLAVLSDRRGQAAVLRAFDALSDERRT